MVNEAWIPVPLAIAEDLDGSLGIDPLARAYTVQDQSGRPLRIRQIYPDGGWRERIGNRFAPQYRALTEEIRRYPALLQRLVLNPGAWELLIDRSDRTARLVEGPRFWDGETRLLPLSAPLHPMGSNQPLGPTAQTAISRFQEENQLATGRMPPELATVPKVIVDPPPPILDAIGTRLVEGARPERLRQNPFRTLQLPATASDRELAKRRQMLEMAIRGGLPSPPGPEQGSPAAERPTLSQISEAADLLRAPEDRLFYHLFWYWRSNLIGDPGLVSLHDWAVEQFYAILGNNPNPIAAAAALRSSGHLVQWCDLIHHSSLRDWLTSYISDMGDARLPTTTADSLLRALPVAVARLSLELGFAGPQGGAHSIVDLYQDVSLHFGTPIARMALESACGPVRERVEANLQALRHSEVSRTPDAWRRLLALVDEVRPLLVHLRLLQPYEHRPDQEIGDQLTLVTAELAGRMRQRSGPAKEALQRLKEMLKFVTRASTRTYIQEEIAEYEYSLVVEPLEALIERGMESSAEPRQAYESLRDRLMPRIQEAIKSLESQALRETLRDGLLHLLRLGSKRLVDQREYALAKEALEWAQKDCTDRAISDELARDLSFVERIRLAEGFSRIFMQIRDANESPGIRLYNVEQILLPRLDELLKLGGGQDEVIKTLRSSAVMLLREIALAFNNELKEPTNALRVMNLAFKYAVEPELLMRLGVDSKVLEDNQKAAAQRAEASSSSCFIATAAYGSPLAREVDLLRQYRDHVLAESRTGRAIITSYYRLSPPIARWIAATTGRRSFVRALLRPVLQLCRLRLRLLDGGMRS